MTPQIVDLPPAVAAYLEANPDTDPAIVADLFAADAVVLDDGRTYRGRVEIASWRADIAGAFTFTATRLNSKHDGGTIVVVERIEGNFPGGRIDLSHRFTLDAAGQINSLTIEPAVTLRDPNS